MTAPSRRGFLKTLAAVPLAPAALTQTPPPSPAAPSPSPPLPSASPEAEDPVAQALAEAVRHRFGAHLRPGDLEEVGKTIADNLRAAERLRRVKLTNADEPVTTFAARPRETRRAPAARRSRPPQAPRSRRRRRGGRTS